jgi:hypothetical protein
MSTNVQHTSTHLDDADRRYDRDQTTRRISTETKSSFKTTEMIAYVVAVAGVLIASAIVDASDFGPQEAWFYVTLLTIGYMVSRGLAKSGTRDFYDDDNNR